MTDLVYAFTEYEFDGEWHQAIFENDKTCPTCGRKVEDRLARRRWNGETESFVETWECKCGKRIMLHLRPVVPDGVWGMGVAQYLRDVQEEDEAYWAQSRG